MSAIKEYENNKWKVIGQKVGKPAKACEQYAKEHFPGRHPQDNAPGPYSANLGLPTYNILDKDARLTRPAHRSLQPCEAWLGAITTTTKRGEESQGGWKEFYAPQHESKAGPESTSSCTRSTCLYKSVQPAPTQPRALSLGSQAPKPAAGQSTWGSGDDGPRPSHIASGVDSTWGVV